MTPDDADGNSNREFAFVSPPAIKKIPGISAGDSTKIVFYIKSSTTGIRGININVTYKVEEDSTKFECHLEEKLNLETTEPFLIASFTSHFAFCSAFSRRECTVKYVEIS